MSHNHLRLATPVHDIEWMIDADRQIQAEIDRGLASLVESPPLKVAHCISRILSAMLVPSWKEHADFQEEALFPALVRSETSTLDTRAFLNRLCREHAEIGECHHDILDMLSEIATADELPSNGDDLARELARLRILRRRHLEDETALDSLLLTALSPRERATLNHWIEGKGARLFPVLRLQDCWK